MRTHFLALPFCYAGLVASAARAETPPPRQPLDAASCAKSLPGVTDINRCWRESAPRGVTVLWVERACSGPCEMTVFVVDDVHGARRFPGTLGWNGVVVLPSGTTAIADEGERSLVSVDLRTEHLRAGARFAHCMGPALSPVGTWIVCRDHAANVLRIPVRGGRLQRFYRWPSRLLGAQPQPPVHFLSPTSMEVPTNETGDSGTVATVPWTE